MCAIRSYSFFGLLSGVIRGTPLLQLAEGHGGAWRVKLEISDPAYDEARFLFLITEAYMELGPR